MSTNTTQNVPIPGGGWLNPAAAAALERAIAAGCPVDYTSAGRTPDQQAELIHLHTIDPVHHAYAAPVDQSEHVIGNAIDAAGAMLTWLVAHPAFGFIRTALPTEPWHLAYRLGRDEHLIPTTAPTPSPAPVPTLEENEMYVLVSHNAQRGYVLVRGDGSTHQFNANPAYTDEWTTWANNHPGVPRIIFNDTPAGNRAFDIEHAVATQPTL